MTTYLAIESLNNPYISDITVMHSVMEEREHPINDPYMKGFGYVIMVGSIPLFLSGSPLGFVYIIAGAWFLYQNGT